MTWVLLFITGLLEVVWATAAGYSDGFTRLVPTLVVFAVMPVTFYLLSVVMQRLPAGTAYAIWTSIGTAGTAILGVIAFGDPVGVFRVLGLCLVIAGVVMLRFADDDSRTTIRGRRPAHGARSLTRASQANHRLREQRGTPAAHSHSIVAGGLLETS